MFALTHHCWTCMQPDETARGGICLPCLNVKSYLHAGHPVEPPEHFAAKLLFGVKLTCVYRQEDDSYVEYTYPVTSDIWKIVENNFVKDIYAPLMKYYQKSDGTLISATLAGLER